MRITIESTSKLVELNGIPARVWEGATEDGVAVHAYVTRIAVAEAETEEAHRRFRQQLSETKAPSAAVAAIPMRLIL